MKRFSLLVGIVLFAGCLSEDDSEETAVLVPVAGVVTLDGDPLASAAVRFVPSDTSTASASYHGATNEAGEFELQSRELRTGCETGDFIVVISKFVGEDGTPMSDDASPEESALGMELLPFKYSRQDQTELSESVPTDGKTDFLFELVSE